MQKTFARRPLHVSVIWRFVILLQNFAGIDVSRALLSAGPCPLCPRPEQTSTAIPLRLLVLNSAEESARVRAELEKGADFAVLAREKSVDATSLDGGLLGKVDPSTLREEIRAALRGLAPGQISPVFRIPSGFAIVKVLAPDELAGIAESQRARQAAIRAEGSIRFDVNVGGFIEAAAALIELCQACPLECRSEPVLRHAAAIVRRFEGPGRETGRSHA